MLNAGHRIRASDLDRFREVWWSHTGTPVSVAPAGSTTLTVASFVMPWDGQIIANGTAVIEQDGAGITFVATSWANSTPAPTASPSTVSRGDSGEDQHTPPLFASWAAESEGQAVDLKLTVNNAGTATVDVFAWAFGTYRLVRL